MILITLLGVNYMKTYITKRGVESLNERAGTKIFPLQTQRSLTDRWGVNRSVVANWAKRHDDFPKEVEGIIEKTAKTPKVYALCDVEAYEKKRGLVK